LKHQTGVAIDEAAIEMRPAPFACARRGVGDRRRGGAPRPPRGEALHRPFLVSVLCAYALEPAVAMLRRWGVPRPSRPSLSICCWPCRHRHGASGHDARHTLCRHVADADRRVPGERDADAGDAHGPLDRLQQTAKTIQQTAAGTRASSRARREARDARRTRFDVRAYLTSASVGVARFSVQLVAIAVMTFPAARHGDLCKQKLVTIAGPRQADKAIRWRSSTASTVGSERI